VRITTGASLLWFTLGLTPFRVTTGASPLRFTLGLTPFGFPGGMKR
jgi:hypothetical protein